MGKQDRVNSRLNDFFDGAVDDTPITKNSTNIKKEDVLDEIVSMMYDDMEKTYIRLEAAKEINRMLGYHAPKKSEIKEDLTVKDDSIKSLSNKDLKELLDTLPEDENV